MNDSRLLKLLQTLEKTEHREFGKFVRSPFFNLRDDVAKLWESLAPYLGTAEKLPGKQVLFEKIYGPGQPFDDHALRMCMSFLVKVVEAYFMQKNFRANPVRGQIHLAAELRSRGLDGFFAKKQAETEQRLATAPHRNADHLADLYSMKLESFLAAAAQKRTGALPLQEVNDTFEEAFLAQKLRQACVALSHQAVFRTDYDFGMLPEALAYVERRGLTDRVAIGVYYHAFRMLRGTAGAYADFSAALAAGLGFFPDGEQRELLLHAINHCIKQYNDGNQSFLAEELFWYKKGLESRVLLQNGVLSRFTYRNVATLALVLGDFEWGEAFINDFRQFLEPAQREANFAFNMARLEYERRNYGTALSLLQQSDYEDTLLALAAKTVLLKIFFETNEMDVLDSHLDAMAAFIRRHKEVGYHAENYRHLVRFVKMLAALPPGPSAEREKLRSEIEGTKAVAEKAWLLGKLS